MAKRRYCPLSGKCGGCEYINEDYSFELIEKHVYLERLLGRYGYIEKILTGDETRYRCKVQAVCGQDRDGKFITGIYRKGTHKLIPVRECHLENGKATAILQTIRQIANRFKISAYDEDTKLGELRHILIRVGYRTDEIMVVLITGDWEFKSKADFVALLHQRHPEIKTIVQIKNNETTSMVIPENAEERVLYGKGYIVDKLCGLRFRISATSFYQVNPQMTEVLYDIAMRMAQLRPTDRVVDAYCGTGTIGLIAASKGVKEVIGIESNADAVQDAIKNAEHNKIENARFINADASKELKEMAKRGEKADVLFLDPPRAGSTEEFLASAKRLDPDVIVYISCNPESLQRDLRYITRFMDYQIDGIQPVDLFPASSHVETICLLSRNK